MSSDEWCLIESDPGVFTELLEKLGCKDVEVEELWSLDDSVLASLQLCYGLIFLFEWKRHEQKEHAASQQPLGEDEIPHNLFFAHQVTTNACATQALLSVLFNAANNGTLPKENLGSTLQEFATFTAEFPPQLKGVAISGSNDILMAHNSFAAQHSFLNEGKQYSDDKKGVAFHFVAYVPVGDTVYELDGLQRGPMVVGKMPLDTESMESDTWLSIARTAIQDRMQNLQGEESSVKFNLLCVGQDKRVALRSKISADDGNDNGAVAAALEHEEQKRAIWKLENDRRRHNYVPLVVQVFRELARADLLRDLTAAAVTQQQQRRQSALQKKKKEREGPK
jgi:ubiquitin carboxyl-terminal hydrolase L5